jgi:hypothetical protein
MELLSVAEVLCIGRQTGGMTWLDEKREKMKEIWWHTGLRSKRKIDEGWLSRSYHPSRPCVLVHRAN